MMLRFNVGNPVDLIKPCGETHMLTILKGQNYLIFTHPTVRLFDSFTDSN